MGAVVQVCKRKGKKEVRPKITTGAVRLSRWVGALGLVHHRLKERRPTLQGGGLQVSAIRKLPCKMELDSRWWEGTVMDSSVLTSDNRKKYHFERYMLGVSPLLLCIWTQV